MTGLGKLESAHGVAIERRHAGAGIPAIVPRLEMDDERWQVQIDTNFTGSADDAAPPVTFIASDDAPMIFGATFDVTGGDSARNLA